LSEADLRIGGGSRSTRHHGLTEKEIFMRWTVRVLGLGIVAVFTALLGLGCGGGAVQIAVGGAPVVVTSARATCGSVCTQMASCPGKGPVCMPSCESTQNLASQAGCDGSVQAELDCLSTQPEVCSATRSACQAQTLALGACITNFCGHQRVGSQNQVLCMQAATGF
jgi:hypothetical protein